MQDNFLIVGAGLYGAVCARELTDAGHRCLVIDKRAHIGGNCYTQWEPSVGCHRHVYGPHIFHTGSKRIWDYAQRFARFNHYVNRPKVRYQNQIYSFPINLLTLYQLYGVTTPEEARAQLEAVRKPVANPDSLEAWCLSQVGEAIYDIFIKGYTQKQWRKHPRDLPASIIQRLPIRLTFEDNYFTHPYQGIPIGGYTALFQRLLDGIEVRLGVDFLADREALARGFDRVIYTGPIDAYFDDRLGKLEYRSLRFEDEYLDLPDFQGNALINYTEAAVPYTRIIEHKHFDLLEGGDRTVITREYPDDWAPGKIEYYPVDVERNRILHRRYQDMAAAVASRVVFGGRLAEYRYYDMDQVMAAALATVQRINTAAA